MLVIRLARGGRNKYPVYRIVAAESARATTGKFIEILGQYNPHTKDLKLDKEQIERRISQGAQPSNSVAKLLQREGMKLPDWVKLETRNRPPKKEPVIKEEAPKAEEAPAAAVVAEAPVEDAPVGSPAIEESPVADSEERVAEAATSNEAEVAEVAPAKPEAAAEKAEAASEAVAEAVTEAASEDKPAA